MPRVSPKATSAKSWNPRHRSAALPSRATSPGSPCSMPPATRAGSPARRSSLPAANGNNSPEPFASGLEALSGGLTHVVRTRNQEIPMAQLEKYDVLVLGSGAGGKLLAWHLAYVGRRTAVVERKWIGGSCPNVNCLPSKNE